MADFGGLDTIISGGGEPEKAVQPDPDNKQLSQDLQGALADLVLKYESVNRQARIEEVRRIQRQREFFKGNQNIYWSDSDKKWKTISSSPGVISQRKDNEELQRFDYVTNIYRPNALITIAVLTQNQPHCIFGPRNADSPQDQATSQASSDVATFIGDNNRLDHRQKKVAYHYFNDGGCAAYVHYEQDGETYGFRQENDIQSMPGSLTPDSWHCPGCGLDTILPPQWSPDDVPQMCPQCGSPITPDNVRNGVRAQVPKLVSSRQVPLGMEKVDYIGFLEFVRPYYASTLEECPFVVWEMELPKAVLRDLYPHVAKKILAGSAGPSEAGANATARQARLALKATSYGRISPEGSTQLVTFRRVWFRPWAFKELDDDKMVQELTSMYPNGCYVAFAGDTYCESRNENMDDMWSVGFAFDGEGMIRDGIGTDLIDVQLRVNTEENIQSETFERGVPSRFLDADVIDVDALADAGALPALDVPVTPKPGRSVADAVYDSAPSPVSPQLVSHIAQLRGEVAQFISGNVPSVWGGPMGGNDTASGISIVKDAALGRMGIFKASMNEFYAQTMMNAIKCFKENRRQDVAFAVLGTGGELDAKMIKLEDLKGQTTVRTEGSESYPISMNQKREMLAGLLQNPSPQMQAIVAYPPNGGTMKTFLGLRDLQIPGESSRKKQIREIGLMMEGQIVMVNPLLDDHNAELQQIKDWYNSDDGQKALLENPQAIQIIQQHAEQHMQQIMLQQQAMNPQPVQGPPSQG